MNKYAGTGAANKFQRTMPNPGRQTLSLTSANIGSGQLTFASKKGLQGRNGNSSGLVITAATPRGNAERENFFVQMSEKINNSIDFSHSS